MPPTIAYRIANTAESPTTAPHRRQAPAHLWSVEEALDGDVGGAVEGADFSGGEFLGELQEAGAVDVPPLLGGEPLRDVAPGGVHTAVLQGDGLVVDGLEVTDDQISGLRMRCGSPNRVALKSSHPQTKGS